jgi:superfamily II DNA or RNA helicase
MSRKILINKISDGDRDQIMKDLTITIEPSSFVYNAQSTYIYPIDIIEDYVYIPFAYGYSCPGGPYNRPERNNLPPMDCKFNGELRILQKEVTSESISDLNKFGSSIISAYTGFGKTASSIYMSTKIKMKTLIITHRIILIKQWIESIKKFCPNAKIQVLTAKSKMEECDFYLMNAINVAKHNSSYYANIGFLIVDEIHCIMSEVLSKSMLVICPRYVLGLSATPYREDGLNVLLDLYFGPKKIYRKLNVKHTVYKIQTKFAPRVEMSKNGRINWGIVLESQAFNQDRNEMIIRLVKYFKDKIFLILCKRIDQGNYLVSRLIEEKEDVTSLIGKQQEFELSSRILVGISSKVGMGMDHPRLNALIMASDIQSYWIQYLGRVMRNEDSQPVIFDIVDKNPILEKHYKERRAIYTDHGGIVKNFSTEYPDFEVI